MKTIFESTVLIPELIADWFAINEEHHKYLCDRADFHYQQKNSHFRDRINRKDGREYLYMFMKHWSRAGLDGMKRWKDARIKLTQKIT